MCENWSEYHSCKECEDEVNRKGNLRNPQRQFMWRMLKDDFYL